MVGEIVESPFEIAVRCFYGMHEWKHGMLKEDVGYISAGQWVRACTNCSKVELVNHFEPPPIPMYH